MTLFDEFPQLTDGTVVLRKMTAADAPSLDELRKSEAVCRFLPTFLYEQKYEDVDEVLARMDAECFETHESLMLGVYLAAAPDELVGLAEIYNHESERRKASIGYRLLERVWGQGIATRITALLKDYLINQVGIRVITAHVIVENAASAAVLRKNGFWLQEIDTHVLEDWGFAEPVVVDKYVFAVDEEPPAL